MKTRMQVQTLNTNAYFYGLDSNAESIVVKALFCFQKWAKKGRKKTCKYNCLLYEALTLLHSEPAKLYGVLTVLSAIGLRKF